MADINDLLDKLDGMNNADSKRILAKLPREKRLEAMRLLEDNNKNMAIDDEIEEPKQSNKFFSNYSSWLANLLASSLNEDMYREASYFERLTPTTQSIIKSTAINIIEQSAKSNNKPIGFFEYLLSFISDTGVRK